MFNSFRNYFKTNLFLKDLCLNLTKIVKDVLPLPVGPLNLFDCNSEAKTEKQIENIYAVSESLEYYVHSEGNDIMVYTMD